ncbi:MAG: N-acetylmuramoyl-L-alanine amidase [Eubacterium sp.]|nr:N-acetylmuramoyl-L-alanine amidase [Eubacterium sp.]
MENLLIALKKAKKLEIFMSVVLLIAVTSIACNMDKVIETENESKTAQAKKTNGKVVVIDPGHGGADPGKVGINGAKEKDVNLAIAKVLRTVLEDKGFEVAMTRTEDKVLGNSSKFSKIGDLNERCEIINNMYTKNNECIMISLHQNSFTQESVHGAQTFYYQRSEKSKSLGEAVQQELNKEVNKEKEKKAKPNDSYYILINSKCPGIIVECGFLSNFTEAGKLVDESYQMQLAEILCSGIMNYFDIK